MRAIEELFLYGAHFSFPGITIKNMFEPNQSCPNIIKTFHLDL